jgi:hypothetical protein
MFQNHGYQHLFQLTYYRNYHLVNFHWIEMYRTLFSIEVSAETNLVGNKAARKTVWPKSRYQIRTATTAIGQLNIRSKSTTAESVAPPQVVPMGKGNKYGCTVQGGILQACVTASMCYSGQACLSLFTWW